MSAFSEAAEAVEQKPEEGRALGAVGPEPKWLRARKWLKWALIATIGVAVLYLVAANIFLRTRLLRHVMNADPVAVLLEYDSGYSLWPGKVHATNLSLRGRDSNVEWILKVDDVDFTVSLNELLRSRFHATRVRGKNVTFQIRQRIEPADATPTRIAALARIPGFGEVPLRDPPKPPLSDADYNLWRVHLEDVVVEHARDVWVDEGRFLGDARIEGGFLLQPARWVTVGPAKVDIAQGEAWTGSDAILKELRGHIGCTIHRFEVQAVSGSDVLDYVSLDAAVDGAIPSLAFVHDLVDVDAEGGSGPVHVEALVDHGILTSAAIDVSNDKAHLDFGSHAILGSAFTHIRATESGVTFEVDATSLDAMRNGERTPLVRIPAATLRTHGHARELRKLFPPDAIHIDVPEGALPDVHSFDAYLAKDGDIHLVRGHGTIRAHATIEGPNARGEAALALVGTEMRMKDGRIWGDLNLDAKIPKANLASRDLDLTGSHVEVANLRSGQSKDARPWAAKATLAPMHAKLGPHFAIDGHVTASCQDARPIVDLLASRSPLPAWAGDLVSTQSVLVRADVRTAPSLIEVRNVRGVVSDRFDLAADYVTRGDHSHSAFLVTSGPLSIGIEAQDGSSHVVLAGTRDWFEGVERNFR